MRIRAPRLVRLLAGFGVVGVLATAIDLGVLSLLTELLGRGSVAAAAASFYVSLAFNYLASTRFVFTGGLSRSREAAAFVSLSPVGLALNELLMWAGMAAGLN